MVRWKRTAETDLDLGRPPGIFVRPAILARNPHGLQTPEDFRPAVQRFAGHLPDVVIVDRGFGMGQEIGRT